MSIAQRPKPSAEQGRAVSRKHLKWRQRTRRPVRVLPVQQRGDSRV